MFGYIRTDPAYLYGKDDILYRAFYCGLCKSIGKSCGQRARFALNYDLTFLSAFAHNVCGEDVQIERQRCVMHWFRKRPMAGVDALSVRVAHLNVILTYHKLSDDVLDSGRRRGLRAFFSGAYRRARAAEPEFDRIVAERYGELIRLEREGCDGIDRAADPFGQMLSDLSVALMGDCADENVKRVFYGVGKWIYLIDALDDIDKDLKKKNFNPFVSSYPEVKGKQSFIAEHKSDLEFLFGSVLYEIANGAQSVSYAFNHDLTDNILARGLMGNTKRIMECESCRKTTKS